MQPTLVITAPVEGMVSINGRFAGEVRPEAPLFAPVTPFGPVWLEFTPLLPAYMPSAHKIVLSAGAPIAESVPEDLFVTLWPGNVAEIELTPRRMPTVEIMEIPPDSLLCRIFRSRDALMEIGRVAVRLPPDAAPLQTHRSGNGLAVTGTAGSGQFLLAMSPDATRQTGFLAADSISFESPELLHAVEYSGDIAGHGTLTKWRLDGAGLTRVSSEDLWEHGIPNRPASAEETARAAAEAALLERYEEAESFFLPGAQPTLRPEEIPDLGALCLPMKYGSPGAPAIALVQPETENLVRALPLYYSAERFGSEWRLTDLHL